MSYYAINIYYFSGTGNALQVSRWIKDLSIEKSIECELFDISITDISSMIRPSNNTLIIFISPIHGFNYPPIMLNFLFKFPKGNNEVLLMNTRAGMRIGKIATPGLTGIAFYYAGIILRAKGYHIRGVLPVDMPSNWISVHPGLNTYTILFLHRKMKERVIKGMSRILVGKKYFRAPIESVLDIAVMPISLGYYFVGRFIFAKTYFSSSACNDCDLCVEGCPVHAITKVDGRPYWTFKCESCMKCMSNCPKQAIETAHGSIAIVSVLFTSVLVVLFYAFFDHYFFKIENKWLEFIIESVLFLVILAIWYRLIHFLMRFKPIERFVVYTSLTKYRFWGRRYKAQNYKS